MGWRQLQSGKPDEGKPTVMRKNGFVESIRNNMKTLRAVPKSKLKELLRSIEDQSKTARLADKLPTQEKQPRRIKKHELNEVTKFPTDLRVTKLLFDRLDSSERSSLFVYLIPASCIISHVDENSHTDRAFEKMSGRLSAKSISSNERNIIIENLARRVFVDWELILANVTFRLQRTSSFKK